MIVQIAVDPNAHQPIRHHVPWRHPGCQSPGHGSSCYGYLWVCERCQIRVCLREGSTTLHELCNSCYSEVAWGRAYWPTLEAWELWWERISEVRQRVAAMEQQRLADDVRRRHIYAALEQGIDIAEAAARVRAGERFAPPQSKVSAEPGCSLRIWQLIIATRLGQESVRAEVASLIGLLIGGVFS